MHGNCNVGSNPTRSATPSRAPILRYVDHCSRVILKKFMRAKVLFTCETLDCSEKGRVYDLTDFTIDAGALGPNSGMNQLICRFRLP